VYTEEILESGEIQELEVTTSEAREVELLLVGDDTSSGPSSGGSTSSPSACNDSGNNQAGWEEDHDHNWRFNRDTAPINQGLGEPDMTKDEAEAALRGGTVDITHTLNDCGLNDNVNGTTATYLGDTSRNSQMSAAGDCVSYFSKDEVNVVDFGDLPYDKVGKTCIWTIYNVGNDEVAESDIRLNRVDHNWTIHPNAPICVNEYDVESLMAHERGHTYGIAHVNEDDHAYLTMSPEVAECSSGPRTLGLGDVQSLRAVYGTT